MNTLTNFDPEKILAESLPLIAAPALPDVRTFCTVQDIAFDPTQKAHVAIVTAGGAVIEDPTDFEQTDFTLVDSPATPVLLSAQWGVNCNARNAGSQLELLLATKINLLQAAIMAKIFAMINPTNFGAPVATAASADFAVAHLQSLLSAVPGRTVIALAPAWYAKVSPTWLPPGTEKTLVECSSFAGAADGTAGFVARPNAISLGVGFPTTMAPKEVTVSMIDLPIGLKAQLSRWYTRGSRSWRASLDIALAVAPGQAALKTLASA